MQTLVLIGLIASSTFASDTESAPELLTPSISDRATFAPDKRHFVTTEGSVAWLIDTHTDIPVLAVDTGPYTLSGDQWANAHFSEDSTTLVLWSFRGSYALVDVDEAKVIRQAVATTKNGDFQDGMIDRNATRLAWTSASELQVLDLATGESLVKTRLPYDSPYFLLSRDGRRLFVPTWRGIDRVDEQADTTWLRTQVASEAWGSIRLLGGESVVLLLRDGESWFINAETGDLIGVG